MFHFTGLNGLVDVYDNADGPCNKALTQFVQSTIPATLDFKGLLVNT